MDSSNFNKTPSSGDRPADNLWNNMGDIPFNGGSDPETNKPNSFQVAPGVTAKGEFERLTGEKVTEETATGRIIGEKYYAELADTTGEDDYPIESWVIKDIADLKLEPKSPEAEKQPNSFQVAPGVTAKSQFESMTGEKVTSETATGRIIGKEHYAELVGTDGGDDYPIESWVIKDIADLKPEPATEELRHDFEQDQDLRDVINEELEEAEWGNDDARRDSGQDFRDVIEDELEDAISESESKPTSPKNPETEKNPEDIEESLVRLENKLREYHKDGKISKNQIDRLIDNLDKFVEKKAKTAAEQDKPSVEQADDEESKRQKIAEAEKKEKRLNELREGELELKRELNQQKNERDALVAAAGEIKNGKRLKFSFLNWLSNLRQNRKQKAKTEEPNLQEPESTTDVPPVQENIKEPEGESNPLETVADENKEAVNFWTSIGQEGLDLMKANYELNNDRIAKVESVWSNLDNNVKDMIAGRYKYFIGSTLRDYLIHEGILSRDDVFNSDEIGRLMDKNKYLDDQYYRWNKTNRNGSAA